MQSLQTVEAKLRAREETPDAEVEAAAAAREITVSFNADVNDNMPWKFQPTQRSIKVNQRQAAVPSWCQVNKSRLKADGQMTDWQSLGAHMIGWTFNLFGL